jgi:hypothetical protein
VQNSSSIFSMRFSPKRIISSQKTFSKHLLKWCYSPDNKFSSENFFSKAS